MSYIQHLSTRQAYIPYVLMVRWLEVYLAFYTRDLVENTFCFSCMEKCASCCMTGKKKLLVWKCIKNAMHLSTTTVTYPDHGATMHLKNGFKRKQEIFYRPWMWSNRLIWGCNLFFWLFRDMSKYIYVRTTFIYLNKFMYIYIYVIHVPSNLITDS